MSNDKQPSRFEVIMEWFKWQIWCVFIFVVSLFEAIFRLRKGPNKRLFWNQVKQCLIKFHALSPEMAEQKINEYKLPLKKSLIYYTEPFQVACDISNQYIKLSPEDYKKLYKEEIMGN